MQSEVASRFSDFGTSAEDDRERDAVADCTVVGGVHRAAEAGILFEVDVSHPMVVVFNWLSSRIVRLNIREHHK